jgi:hypothetical protein
MPNKRHKKPFQFNKTQNKNETKQTKKLSQQRPLTKRQTSPYTVAKSLKLCRQKLSKKKNGKKGIRHCCLIRESNPRTLACKASAIATLPLGYI